jgi:TonB family protein
MPGNQTSERKPGTGETANDQFKKSYVNWFYGGVIIAVALHFSFFQLFPNLQASEMADTGKEMEAVELPPQVDIPPPPEQIARPATPQVAQAQVNEDVTIAPTTFEENPTEKLPPPPKAGSPSDRPSFIPRDVDPRATNDDEIRKLLQRYYPPMLREAGIGGTVTLWLFVDKNGDVAKAQVQKSSGYDAFDKAAKKVAANMEFKPAINRDKPIGVWVSRRITFNVK